METTTFKAFVPTKQDEKSGQQKGRSNQKPVKQEGETQHCTFYDKDDHNHDGCFKNIGYTEWWLGKGKVEKGNSRVAFFEMETSP